MSARSLDDLVIRPPHPSEAASWTRFLIAQQVVAYTGLVPADFAARELLDSEIESLARTFADPGTGSYRIALDGDAIVGVASALDAPADWEIELGLVPSPAPRELGRLYVDAAWQGSGLAGALLELVVDETPHYLWLIDGNARAARFYERRGFVHLAESHPAGGSWGGIPMHRMIRGASVDVPTQR